MASQDWFVNNVGGRWSLVILGCAYMLAGIAWSAFEIYTGEPVVNLLVVLLFIAGPGAILIVGGVRLSKSNIAPRYFGHVTAWTLGGIGVMIVLLTLYHVQPGTELSHVIENTLTITALAAVAAYGAGVYNARAQTNAHELERTLDLLQATERTADVGGWEIDPETLDVFWSDNLFEILDIESNGAPTLEEALDVYHEEDRHLVTEAVENAIDHGEPFDIVVRFRTPAEEVRWLRVQGNPEVTDGEVVSLRGAAQDITARKEMERNLRESEAKFRMIAQNLDEVIWMATADGEEFVYVNPTVEEIWGLDRATLYDDSGSFLDAVHEDDRTRVQAAYERLPETRFDEEYRIIRPDGEMRWIHARGHVVADTGIDANRVIGISQDITERKERERALDKQVRQQRAVSDLGHLALETDDLDAFMHEASRRVSAVLDTAYCKVLDLDRQQEALLLRQGVGWDAGIVGEATVSAVEDDSQAAYTLASDQPIVVEELDTETRFSGPALLTSHNVASGISTIIGPDDNPWGILGTHDVEPRSYSDEDVTFVESVANILAETIERHQYQTELERLVTDLEESNERLEQFAYAASHDLQEPLRMVSSYLQLIERRYEDVLDEDGEEFLDYAVDGADRMRAMIDGLLQYSRVETEGEPLERVDLNEVVADVQQDIDMQITESGAGMEVADLPAVRGDRSQLHQVFQNLFRNAIEYSGEHDPSIHVSAERRNTSWVVHVRDEGIGIDTDQHTRIFDVFQRLDTQTDTNGSGIGLALCERIIERHGGDISVESTPGEGSTFSFTLPVIDTHNE